MKIKNILLCASVLMLGSMNTVSAAGATTIEVPNTKPFVKLISNVVYEQVPSRGYDNMAMKMDILKPQTKSSLPAIVYVTGGGFINANKDSYIQQRVELAEAGYVVASIEYRVAPTAVFPEPLEDVKAAVRYLRANSAKLGINKKKVGIMGGSAGGYLVAMAGVTSNTKTFDKGENLKESSSVQAVVDTYGVSDLTKIGADYNEDVQELHKSAGATEALWVNGSPVFGGKDGGILADPQKAQAANPLTYVSAQTPPFLLFHGDADVVVSPSQSQLVYDALQAKNVESELYYVKGAAHGGPIWVQKPIMDKVITFFNKHLK